MTSACRYLTIVYESNKPCIWDLVEFTKRAEGAENAVRTLTKHIEDERVEKERYRQLANQCKQVRHLVVNVWNNFNLED